MSDRPKRFKLGQKRREGFTGHLSNLSIWLKPIKMREEEEEGAWGGVNKNNVFVARKTYFAFILLNTHGLGADNR